MSQPKTPLFSPEAKFAQLYDPDGMLDDWLISSPKVPCNWTGNSCSNSSSKEMEEREEKLPLMASFTVHAPKLSLPLVFSSQSAQKRDHIASFPRADPRLNNSSLIARVPVNSLHRLDIHKACAQLNNVAVEKISNSSPSLEAVEIDNSDDQVEVPDASSVSTFMAHVKDLVKLVDSKDIVELQLKQMDCEVHIRKKEALPQPAIPAPVALTTPPTHQVIHTPQMLPASVPAAASVPSTPAPVATSATPSKPKSSHPPFKCPMAGTFYRSPAPGAPPFVKIGDKVQKGQVLCIIEAMKLMNEIEADQSGTIVEILAGDGKPVSVDTPLFIIEP